ncbi:phage holin [Peribacillus frigoritolerans]|uniref:phage holin n=1 Tax=Peribacillus frigoritolerans TaxID=450367 RepID=UPI00207AC175|nr:phage holin [Peribacillus frigoritolerans]USK77678.1 phage holin [Peribacillus frigoritolerans]USK77759.1 phage holin [Peribacillus frigoritolerans]USK77908.1 phage holin [Peribacillus frigoritolerans]
MSEKQKINWGVRFKNKVWVSGFVSQTLLMLQAIFLGLESLQVIDINIESVDAWVAWLTGITNVILAYLAYLGLVVDPTVQGVGDSYKALKRTEPLREE